MIRYSILIFWIFIIQISCQGKDGLPAVVTSLTTNTNASYGKYIADSNNIALYMFELDKAGVSNCYDNCAVVWPPFIVADGASVTVDSTISSSVVIGYTTRKDGKRQLTINDWPAYYYKGEVSSPNVVKCQGIVESNGLWIIFSPNGNVNFNVKQIPTSTTNPIIALSSSQAFGSNYIIDSSGVPLYINSGDTFLKSNCKGTCLDTWKPFGPTNADGALFMNSSGNYIKNSDLALTVGTGIDGTLLSIAKISNSGNL